MAIGKVMLLDVIASYTGQPVAILCNRYWYRGVVRDVGTDYLVLDPARVVTDTGPFNAERPNAEAAIPSPLVIAAGTIEQFCQPGWAWFEMPVARPQKK